VDEDEDGRRSGGVAVCALGSEAGAVASGATAPVTSEEDPPAGTTETAPAEGAEAWAVSDGAAPSFADDDTADDADHGVEVDPVEVDGAEVHDTVMAVFDPPEVEWVAAPPAPQVEPASPRHSAYLRRGVVAVVAAGFVSSALSAFAWIAPSPEAANQQFVAAVQSEGRVVPSAGQESLLVTAARKICDRKDAAHTSDRDRRATALTRDELGAVGAAFGAHTREFTALALKTYCSR
jgi:hypothetical protein